MVSPAEVARQMVRIGNLIDRVIKASSEGGREATPLQLTAQDVDDLVMVLRSIRDGEVQRRGRSSQRQ